jgi:hypothetical protein
MGELWEYLIVLAGYGKWILTGGPFLAENIVKRVKPSWTQWLDKRIAAATRVRIEVGIIIVAVFFAGFLAWRDEHLARHFASNNPLQQTTIDRLSADLTAARGKIDAQDKLIEAQQSQIVSQDSEIQKLKPKPPRHLSEQDKARLTEAFSKIKGDYPTLAISAPGDGEAQGFAHELMTTFDGLGIHVDRVGFVIATSAANPPLQVVVKDISKVPPKAERFAEAMIEAGFPVKGGVFDTLGEDQFALIVASVH